MKESKRTKAYIATKKKRESQIQSETMIEASKVGSRLFRNNSLKAWAGEARKLSHPQTLTLPAGTVIVQNGYPIKAGLCNGSTDCIGWHTVTISKNMIGKKIAVFTAPEIKSENGRASIEQNRFIKAVLDAGGFSMLIKDKSEYVTEIKNFIRRLDTPSAKLIEQNNQGENTDETQVPTC